MIIVSMYVNTLRRNDCLSYVIGCYYCIHLYQQHQHLTFTFADSEQLDHVNL
jgi:hypothetical protein